MNMAQRFCSLNMTLGIDFFTITPRIEPLTYDSKTFFLKTLRSERFFENMTQKLNVFFAKYDSKNWIFFFFENMTRRIERFENMIQRIQYFLKT